MHPRPYQVSERKVARWAQAELAGDAQMVTKRGMVGDAAAIEARLARLARKRAKIIEDYREEVIDKVERDRDLAAVAADRAKV